MSRLKFWRKKCVHEYLAVVEPEPRILTGIEKHELELAEIAQQENNAKLFAIRKRIQELEAEIAPQVALLAQLRAQVTPYWYYAYSQMRSNPLMQYQHLRPCSGDFGSGLLGGIGR